MATEPYIPAIPLVPRSPSQGELPKAEGVPPGPYSCSKRDFSPRKWDSQGTPDE